MLKRLLDKKTAFITVLLFVTGVFLVGAQSTEPAAILEYYDDAFEIEITDADGMLVEDVYYGMELLPGDTITTYGSTAELRLDPNGSILKLANNTNFQIQALQTDAQSSNDFALLGGKLRTIAARTGAGENYSIQTQTAVCGVRGTDFLTEAVGRVTVKRGLVQVDNLRTGESVSLSTGQFVDAAAAVFEAVQLTAEQIEEAYNDVQLVSLDEMSVPGNETAPEPEAEAEPEEEPEEEVAAEEEPPEDAAPPAMPEEPAVTAEEEPEEAPEPEAAPGPFDAAFEKLREILGMEIGTVTINDTTYSKAILQPQFSLGKLKMALYLPIIYESNMFDPADWYHPEGNDEWSFGTDYDWESDPWGGVQDVVSDLFLKIRYVQWGEQRDKFFLKVGNLNNMTIGHGLLMYNFANDADFPTVRRVGLNTGLQGDKVGIEAVVNDLAAPEIFGGRFFFRPFLPFKMAFGVSGIVDWNPVKNLPTGTGEAYEDYADLKFINASLDFDLPIVETDFMSIILFGDVGGMMPWLGGALRYDVLYDADAAAAGNLFDGLRNYGIASGVFGNLFVVDYRLEYRNYNGAFRPAFFNTTYERMRGTYVDELIDLLDGNVTEANTVMGIYGELGFELEDLFRLEGGYMWPWQTNDAGDVEMDMGADYLTLEASLAPDVIPVVGIYGSIGYHRTGLAQSITDAAASDDVRFMLINENTVFKGELVYPVAPTLDVALLLTGGVSYDDAGEAGPYTTITIDTRVHF